MNDTQLRNIADGRGVVIDLCAKEILLSINESKEFNERLKIVEDRISKLELELKNEKIVHGNLKVRYDDARKEIEELKLQRDGALK